MHMYYLMNKDNVAAVICVKPATEFSDRVVFELHKKTGDLPIGFKEINSWIENRKGSKHNTHLQTLMKQLGCDNNEDFIKITHATTINDTFWLKAESENISWDQVSLYRNQFNETISKLAFEGIGSNDVSFSLNSPELTCEGSFRKCFRKEDKTGENGSDIFLYKRGGEFGKGLEPYCETLSSEIAKIISPDNSVFYSLTTLYDKLVSKCELFTNERYGYVSYAKIADTSTHNLQNVYDFFESIGCEQQFRELLVTDALCFNQDRHTGNYGVLFDNDTLEIVSIAPIFDLNISLLPYVSTEGFENIGSKLFVCSPKLGEDFTRLGQMGMNDIIRNRVKDMCDFSFSFRGDDTFSPERVSCLEKIVRKQAQAILSNDKLYTKDVFFSQKACQIERNNDNRAKACQTMNGFMEVLERKDLGEGVFISEFDSVEIIVENEQYTLNIDFLKGNIDVSSNLHTISFEEMQKESADFWNVCITVVNELNKYMESIKDNTLESALKELKKSA